MVACCYHNTPIGVLCLISNGQAITEMRFCQREPAVCPLPADQLLIQALRELDDYFVGTRHTFSLPLAPVGTPFQQRVWQALRTIPYGQSRSYKQIAEQIGAPRACRAVGMASHRNPLPILIPCHRVIGSQGALVGYAGGLSIKKKLLDLETEE